MRSKTVDRNFIFSISAILLGVFLFVNSLNVNAQHYLLNDSFDESTLNSRNWGVTWWTPDGQLDEGIDPEIVTDPVRYGNSAVKIRAQHNWNGEMNYTRTEITGKRSDNGSHMTFFYPGKEYWIGFSVYLPTDWVNDTKSEEAIFQLHGNGNEDTPSLAFVVDGEEWYWTIRWQDEFEAPEEPNDRIEKGRIYYEKGKWVDWVIHVKFSYSNDGYGFMQVWKNGTSLFTHKGPNCYNDGKKIRGPQTGIYKWDWPHSDREFLATERIMYLDEFKVGDETCSYDDVAPGSSSGIDQNKNISGELSVYPNPTSDRLIISNIPISKDDTSIVIYNSNMQQVKTLNIKGKTTITIDVSDLKSGVYFCKMKTNNLKIKKFVVVR
jgi:hypothetical protein